MGKHKKSKHRSSSEDSDDSDSSRNAKHSSHKKRKHSKSDRSKKDILKQEKKLLKKDIKDQEDSQLAMHLAVNLGYSNSTNPFGDSNLGGKFVWVKKREQDAKMGITSEERLQHDLKKRKEVQAELEALNQRRVQRDIEAELRASEAERLQREQDLAALGDWKSREDSFHLEQFHSRAQIRISAGRAKPIDILAMNVSLASDTPTAMKFESLGLEFDLEEPYLIFNRLTLKEIEELHNDIRMYSELEKDENNKKFWDSMIVVCEDELAKSRDDAKAVTRSGVHVAVAAEINKLLSEKTTSQLDLMMNQVKNRLDGPNPGDVEYWEALLKGIVVWKAKAALKDMHAFMLRKRIERLKKIAEESGELPETRGKVSDMLAGAMTTKVESNPEEVAIETEVEETVEPYDPRMSPVPIAHLSRDDKNLDVVDEHFDLQLLLEQRQKVISKFGKSRQQEISIEDSNSNAYVYTEIEDELYRLEAERAVESDEEIMGEETSVIGAANKPREIRISIPTNSRQRNYATDKYRPRKPRYLNRVQTGYEWNKYNQTHYDTDNPPPKVVQGYKFNIFYPDLIDKTITPTYKRVKDPQSEDTEILLFTAGPPYEDVAFKIVKKEWELSHKKGFKNAFDRGVLQLHFHFKRHYYRR